MAIKRMKQLLKFDVSAPKLMRFDDNNKSDLAEKLKERYYKNEAKIDSNDEIHIDNAQSWDPETDEKYRDGHTGDSSLVAGIDYDDSSKELTVKWRDAFGYDQTTYKDVPREVAEEFAQAPSKGRFAINELWNKYKY